MVRAPLESYWRAMRVLRRLSNTSGAHRAPSEDSIALSGEQVFRYAPERLTGPVLVLLHGVTARGAQDQHLVRLARVLAAEGLTAYVPHLPGLANFAEDPRDLTRIHQSIHMASLDGSRQVSILGFSIGGGYGLVSVTNPDVAGLIDRTTVVGAHHRLDEIWARMSAQLAGLLERIEHATVSDLYCALGCAQQRLSDVQLGSEAARALRALLWNYCDSVDRAAVRRFVVSHLSPHWSIVSDFRPSAHSLELSPVGRLHHVRSPVALLHAPDDALVPKHHALRNLQELRQRRSNAQSMFTTQLLDHVKPRLSKCWSEVPGLIQCFAELLT